MSQPNAGNILIPEGRAADLFTVMDEVKKQLANNTTEREALIQETREAIKTQDATRLAEIAALRAELEKTQADLKATEARCDVLDKNQARGSKLYTEEAIPGVVGGISRAQRNGLIEIGKALHDGFSLHRNGTPKFGIVTRDQTVGTDSKGGYGVPRPIEEQVVALTPMFGFIDKYATVFEMPSLTLDIDTSSGFPTVSHPGEATAPSDTGVTFGRVRMTAEKFISTNLHSVEFLQDAMPGVLQFVARRHVQAQARERDRQATSASADPFTGVFFADNVGELVLGTGSTSFRHIDHDAIMDTIDKADESLFQDDGNEYGNLRWLFHPQFLITARKIKDTTGQPLLAALAVGHPLTLAGFEYSRHVLGNKQITTGAGSSGKIAAVIGDWSYVWVGDRMEMSVGFSDQVKYGEAQVMMRVMRRYAVLPVIPQAFGRLKLA